MSDVLKQHPYFTRGLMAAFGYYILFVLVGSMLTVMPDLMPRNDNWRLAASFLLDVSAVMLMPFIFVWCIDCFPTAALNLDLFPALLFTTFFNGVFWGVVIGGVGKLQSTLIARHMARSRH